MSRKDYVAFARIIKTNLEISHSPLERVTVKGVATDMADLFAADNPRFDRQKFLTACGF